MVALFINNRFSYIIEIDGELPGFIKFPREFNFKFEDLQKPLNKKNRFITDLNDTFRAIDVKKLSGYEIGFY